MFCGMGLHPHKKFLQSKLPKRISYSYQSYLRVLEKPLVKLTALIEKNLKKKEKKCPKASGSILTFFPLLLLLERDFHRIL